MSIYLLSFLLFFATKAEDKPRIFSYRIQQLKDYDFFNQMQLEKKMEKPWLVLFFMTHEEVSKKMIPIYDKLAEDFKTTNMYFAAIDIYENEDVRDRIVVQQFPHLIYFDTNSLMYRYTGELSLEGLTEFLKDEQWIQMEGKKIPKEINYWKRTIRKMTGFIAITIYSIILTIIGIIYYFVQRSRQNLLKKIRRMDFAQQKIMEKKKKYFKLE